MTPFIGRAACLIASLVVLFGATHPVAAQLPAAGTGQPPVRATFLLLVNGDTMVIENSTRTATGLSGEILIRAQGARFVYRADLTPQAGIATLESAYYRGADSVPALRSEIHGRGETLRVHTGSAVQDIATGARALPAVVNVSSAFLEQMVMYARAQGGVEESFPVFYVMGGATTPATVRQLRHAGGAGADSAVIDLPGIQIRLAVGADGRVLGGTVPSQRGRIVRLENHATVAPEAIDYSAPSGAPYTSEEVRLTTPAGIRLAGTLTVPAGAPGVRHPAVVTISGSGAQTRDGVSMGLSGYRPFRQIADTLGRRGIAVLRLDDRGTGGSDLGPMTATSADFADDVRAALAFLRAYPGIDGARLALVGHSEGAIIAPMVSASDTALRALVLMAGTGRAGRLVLPYQQQYYVDSVAKLTGPRRDAAIAAMQAATDSLAASVPWMRFFLDHDPAVPARQLRADVLILHGEMDRQVPVSEADLLASVIRAGGRAAVSVRTFPGLNHLFVPHGGAGFDYSSLPSLAVEPPVLGEMADWLVRSLGRRSR